MSAIRRLELALDAEWNEGDHPRSASGQFGSGGGSTSSGAKEGEKKEEKKAPTSGGGGTVIVRYDTYESPNKKGTFVARRMKSPKRLNEKGEAHPFGTFGVETEILGHFKSKAEAEAAVAKRKAKGAATMTKGDGALDALDASLEESG